MKDYIYEENEKWCYDECLLPESRGWVTHSFDTKEQAEAHREGKENPGLAKMARGDVERVDGLAEAICFFEDCTNDLPQQESDYMHKILEAARLQLKRQGE